MSAGAFVRRLFGRHERRVADAYRGIYFDLDSYVAQLLAWAPHATRILEVGCGEGTVTERLAAAYPDARIVATDISDRLGRLYAGPSDRVRFVQGDVAGVADAMPAAFDLAIVTDVLHHVPDAARAGLVAATRRALRPGGALIVKEWEKRPTPIYWLGYASDRWLTGDRIRYMKRAELRGLLGGGAIDEARLRPWATNIALRVHA